MIGKTNIINTAADLELSEMTAAQVLEMAKIKTRVDVAIYPADYDENLTEADEGYIAPIYEFIESVDQAVLNRFGLTA